LVALGTGALIAGCDNDAKLTKSGEGEACERTADCEDNLKCIQGACYRSASGGNEGGEGNGTGGSMVGPPAPVLGGPGESCTKRADCEEGLGCFNERCVEDAGEGGAGPGGGPELGGPGETCVLTSDCEAGLSCVPQTGFFGTALQNIGFSNVCAAVDTGIEPTGNVCGHECIEDKDCCELPLDYHLAAGTYPFSIGANSCAQLADLLTGVNCASPTALAVPINAARCFAQATFCDCADTTWSCTGGRCVYEEACTITALDAPDQPGGCPARSRAGNVLTQTCDADSERCGAVAATGCTTDATCEGEYVADSLLTDICVTDECTCYEATGQCYRKCFKNQDCRAGRVCDTTTSVCVLAPACEQDIECAVEAGDFRYRCIEGVCDFLCENDLDCNPQGLILGGFYQVCGSDNRCHELGCASHGECPAGVGGVQLFCGAAAPADEGTVESALTGGTPE
jgi:hypothetical protein